jgi:hypothetical protein
MIEARTSLRGSAATKQSRLGYHSYRLAMLPEMDAQYLPSLGAQQLRNASVSSLHFETGCSNSGRIADAA